MSVRRGNERGGAGRNRKEDFDPLGPVDVEHLSRPLPCLVAMQRLGRLKGLDETSQGPHFLWNSAH